MKYSQNPKIFKKPVVLFILKTFIICIGVSCKKSEIPIVDFNSISFKLKNTPQYSLFYRALQRLHVDSLLSGSDSYTVFLPTDSAMMRQGLDANQIDRENLDSLKSTISFHISPGKVSSIDLPKFKQFPLTTIDSGKIAYFEFNNYGLFINGISIIHPDIQANNGIIHEINEVLSPPTSDIYTTVASIPELSFFYYYINTYSVKGFGYQALYGTPISPKDYFDYPLRVQGRLSTLLALSNEAFYANGINSINLLDNYLLAQNKLNTLYLDPKDYFNFGAGQYFTSGFLGSFKFVLKNSLIRPVSAYILQDGKTGYGLTPISRAPNNPTAYPSTLPFHIIKGNIFCTNGVIHIIDQFLQN